MDLLRKKIFIISFCLVSLGGLNIGYDNASYLHAKSSSANQSASWRKDVNELDEKIAVLKRWQNGYKMTAEQAQFKADRLQFEQDQLLDAKRLWKVAENAKQKAEDLQVIIEKLENQRNVILKRHNQPIPKG